MNNEERQPRFHKIRWYVSRLKRYISSRSRRTIEVEIPRGFMNCGVSTDNYFVSDTNDISNWDTLKFPLPKARYQWSINSYTGDIDNPNKKTVVLIDKY
jgi:hypothetical protein